MDRAVSVTGTGGRGRFPRPPPPQPAARRPDEDREAAHLRRPPALGAPVRAASTRCSPSGRGRMLWRAVLDQPLATAEFLAVDTETNGLRGRALRADRGRRGARRRRRAARRVGLAGRRRRAARARHPALHRDLAGDGRPAPPPEDVLPELARSCAAGCSSPTTRVRRARAAAGVRARGARLARSARALHGRAGPPVRAAAEAPRARDAGRRARDRGDRSTARCRTPDVRARVLRAVRPAVRERGDGRRGGRAARRAQGPRPRPRRGAAAPARRAARTSPRCRTSPGVYVFRDADGRPLYVGKSVDLRTRARAHFTRRRGVDGARRARRPPGDGVRARRAAARGPADQGAAAAGQQARQGASRTATSTSAAGWTSRSRSSRSRASRPPGHAVCVGPVRGRAAAAELVEQLNSLFGLRHCGRALPRREHPSAYGQMGRCLSPCLRRPRPEPLPRAARRRRCGCSSGRDGGAALLAHVDAQIRDGVARRALRARRVAAAPARAARGAARPARRRAARDPRRRAAVLAPHPTEAGRFDAVLVAGGRVVDWGPRRGDPDELARRSAAALGGAAARTLGGWLPADEVDEARLVGAWVAANAPPMLELGRRGTPAHAALRARQLGARCSVGGVIRGVDHVQLAAPPAARPRRAASRRAARSGRAAEAEAARGPRRRLGRLRPAAARAGRRGMQDGHAATAQGPRRAAGRATADQADARRARRARSRRLQAAAVRTGTTYARRRRVRRGDRERRGHPGATGASRWWRLPSARSPPYTGPQPACRRLAPSSPGRDGAWCRCDFARAASAGCARGAASRRPRMRPRGHRDGLERLCVDGDRRQRGAAAARLGAELRDGAGRRLRRGQRDRSRPPPVSRRAAGRAARTPRTPRRRRRRSACSSRSSRASSDTLQPRYDASLAAVRTRRPGAKAGGIAAGEGAASDARRACRRRPRRPLHPGVGHHAGA